MTFKAGNFPPAVAEAWNSTRVIEEPKVKDPIVDKLNHSVTLFKEGACFQKGTCQQLDHHIVELTDLVTRTGIDQPEVIKEQAMKIRTVVNHLAKGESVSSEELKGLNKNLQKLIKALDKKVAQRESARPDSALRASLVKNLQSLSQQGVKIPSISSTMMPTSLKEKTKKHSYKIV